MPDWEAQLDDEERKQWNDWLEHHRVNTVRQMDDSAFVLSLVSGAEVDIKFAVELGLSIMLDKPILAVVMPGTEIPEKLAKVADRIAVVDIDQEDGRDQLVHEIKMMMHGLK